jgi:hypothetical protein
MEPTGAELVREAAREERAAAIDQAWSVGWRGRRYALPQSVECACIRSGRSGWHSRWRDRDSAHTDAPRSHLVQQWRYPQRRRNYARYLRSERWRILPVEVKARHPHCAACRGVVRREGHHRYDQKAGRSVLYHVRHRR